ncbi:MAG: hypothetical protein WBG90_18315 [Saonia sp.]
MENTTNGLNSFDGEQGKDRELILKAILKEIEKGEGLRFSEIKKKYGEEQLFYISLKYVTTTKKVLCMATEIPVEAACRYKRYFEGIGLLKQSTNDVICPYTKHPARLISTNPDEFDGLDNSNQIKLF